MPSAWLKYGIILTVFCAALHAQINPRTQIAWPANCGTAGMVYSWYLNQCIVSGGGGGGGMNNPMTTAGDIIIGGSSGTPQRLAAGSNTQVLTITGGSPAWATPASGGANFPGTNGFVFNTSTSSSRNATAADLNSLAVTATGCSIPGTVYSPSGGSCTPISQTLAPSTFGAKFDGQRAYDCATVAGSTTLTCVSNHFAPSDAGKKIAVSFAGPPGAPISVTSYAGVSNTWTFQGTNTLASGNIISFPANAFPTSTWFNGQFCTVIATGLSGTQFSANACSFTHADASATEAGKVLAPPSFGAVLLTTIAAYVSPTQVTLTAPAQATIPAPRTIHVYWSASATTISETDNDLTIGDQGKKFELPEGGFLNLGTSTGLANQNLVAKVTSLGSMTVPFVLNYAGGSATTPVAVQLPGASVIWGSDDCIAWEKAIQASNVQGKRLWMDAGVSLTGCPLPLLHNVIVEGQGVGISTIAPVGGLEFSGAGIVTGTFTWEGGQNIYPTGNGAQIVQGVTTGPMGFCYVDWAQSPDGINPPGSGYATGDHLLPIEPGASSTTGFYCVVGAVTAGGAPLNYTGSTLNGVGFYSAVNLAVTPKTGTGTGAKVILAVGPLTHTGLDNFEIDNTWAQTTSNGGGYAKANFMRPMMYSRIFQMYAHDCQATCLGNDYMKMSLYKDNVSEWAGKEAYMFPSVPGGSAGIGIGTGLWAREEQLITNNLIRYAGIRGIFTETQGQVQSTGISIMNNIINVTGAEGVGDHGNQGVIIEGNSISNTPVCGTVVLGFGSGYSDNDIVNNNLCEQFSTTGWSIQAAGAGLTFTNNRILVSASGATLPGTTGVSVQVVGGPVNSAVVNTGGAGCVTGDLLFAKQGSAATGFQAVVTGNATPAAVSAFTIISGGSGYITATGLTMSSSSTTCTGVKLNITAGTSGPLKFEGNVIKNIGQRSMQFTGTVGGFGLVEIRNNQIIDSGWSLARPAIDITQGTIAALYLDGNILAAHRVAAAATYGLTIEAGVTVSKLWTGTNNDFTAGTSGTIQNLGTLTSWVGPEMEQSGTGALASGTLVVTLAPMFASTSSFRCWAIDTSTNANVPCTINSVTQITITGTGTNPVQWTTSGR